MSLAAVLQEKGIMDYVRGAVKVVNRRKLQNSSSKAPKFFLAH